MSNCNSASYCTGFSNISFQHTSMRIENCVFHPFFNVYFIEFHYVDYGQCSTFVQSQRIDSLNRILDLCFSFDYLTFCWTFRPRLSKWSWRFDSTFVTPFHITSYCVYRYIGNKSVCLLTISQFYPISKKTSRF